jgi:hypothetical protein
MACGATAGVTAQASIVRRNSVVLAPIEINPDAPCICTNPRSDTLIAIGGNTLANGTVAIVCAHSSGRVDTSRHQNCQRF